MVQEEYEKFYALISFKILGVIAVDSTLLGRVAIVILSYAITAIMNYLNNQ